MVVIAYGERGHRWLRQVAAVCRQHPLLVRLLEAEVMQLWSVEGASDGSDPAHLTRVSVGWTPQQAREALDQGRSAESQAEIPNFDVRRVLVLERCSAFDVAAQHRPAVRALLDGAARGAADPSSTHYDVELDWLALTDLVRPAGRVSDDVAQRVRDVVNDNLIAGERTLLIDRVNANGAVISEALADHCFQQIAVGIVTSDVAFPPPNAGSERRSALLGRVAGDPAVHPVSVLTLQHRRADVVESRVRHLLRVLAEGIPLSAMPAQSVTNAEDELTVLAERERAQLAEGTYDAHAARTRRQRSAEALLRNAFTRRDVRGARQTVDRARATARAIAAAPADGTPTVTHPVARAGALSALTLTPQDLPAVALVAVAVAGSVAWALARRRRSTEQAAPVPVSTGASAQQRDDAAHEWEALCAALGEVLGRWKDVLGDSQLGVAAPDAPVWEQLEMPYDWRLVAAPELPEREHASATMYGVLAEACLRQYDADTPAARIFDRAVQEVAERDLGSRPDLAGAYLRAALESSGAAPLKSAVQRAGLMVDASRVVGPREILWLADPALLLNDPLCDLEAASNRSAARVLTHDDASRTTRIAVGDALPWGGVLSLSFLGAR